MESVIKLYKSNGDEVVITVKVDQRKLARFLGDKMVRHNRKKTQLLYGAITAVMSVNPEMSKE